jgi:hypothetical protein
MTDVVDHQSTPARRWLARLSFVLIVAAEVTVLTTKEVEITADMAQVPVGIDGESVAMPVPVTCTISPHALRVWVPRDRPGVPEPPPAMNWTRLRQLAGFGREHAEMTA